MKHNLLIVGITLLFLTIGNVFAQSKCGIDSRVAIEKYTKSSTTKGHNDLVRVVAKVSANFDAEKQKRAGIVIGSRFNDIVTLRIPANQLWRLDSDNSILQYQVARPVAPECNVIRFDTRTDSVHGGLGLPQGQAFDGSGVIIGVTDWGFDYTHPNFNNGDASNHRILRAWDQFKLSGPAPDGFDYGTEHVGYDALIAAKCDTFGLYGYNTHASHVTGIAAGRGINNGNYQGQAPGAQILSASFLLDEAGWLDAVAWMKRVAEEEGKRLVINSSWGMYTFSTLDGTSLLSQAINRLSSEGIVFVTSGGNNGDATMHISKAFTNETDDTLKTVATYYSAGIGQALILWGEAGKDFDAAVGIFGNDSLSISPFWNSASSGYKDTFLISGIDTIRYNVMWEHANPFNNRSHIIFNVAKVKNYQLRMFVTAHEGTVHAWNIDLQENNAGNIGCDFSKSGIPFYTNGDNLYGIGEPACAESSIAVAAHIADRINARGAYVPGSLTSFSSIGPTLDGRNKPEISAPGSAIVSSISSYTTDSYTAVASTFYNGRRYIFAEMSGTSMSSPAVTGIVALMLQANPNLSVEQVRNILFSSARNDNATGNIHESGIMSHSWGWGKADALKAVNGALDQLSIEEAIDKQQPLSVYPNPATSSVTVLTSSNVPLTVSVFSLDGKKMCEQIISAEGTIDVSRWENGIYIARMQDRTGMKTAKIVVCK